MCLKLISIENRTKYQSIIHSWLLLTNHEQTNFEQPASDYNIKKGKKHIVMG